MPRDAFNYNSCNRNREPGYKEPVAKALSERTRVKTYGHWYSKMESGFIWKWRACFRAVCELVCIVVHYSFISVASWRACRIILKTPVSICSAHPASMVLNCVKITFSHIIFSVFGNIPCRKIWSGRWSAQDRNVGYRYWTDDRSRLGW